MATAIRKAAVQGICLQFNTQFHSGMQYFKALLILSQFAQVITTSAFLM